MEHTVDVVVSYVGADELGGVISHPDQHGRVRIHIKRNDACLHHHQVKSDSPGRSRCARNLNHSP